jgi:hypothetical protein
MLFLQIPEGSLQGYETHETLVLEKYQVLQGLAFSFNKTLVCAVWRHNRLEQISSHQVLAALRATAASIGSARLSFKPNEDPGNTTTATMPRQDKILEATCLEWCSCQLSLVSTNQFMARGKLMEEVSSS